MPKLLRFSKIKVTENTEPIGKDSDNTLKYLFNKDIQYQVENDPNAGFMDSLKLIFYRNIIIIVFMIFFIIQLSESVKYLPSKEPHIRTFFLFYTIMNSIGGVTYCFTNVCSSIYYHFFPFKPPI